MEQAQLYGIGVYEEAIVLTDYTGKAEKQYLIDEKQLMEFFRFNKEVTFDAFPGLIKMIADLEGNKSFVVTRPREKRKLIYSKDKKLIHVPMEMPPLLIAANINSRGQCRINYIAAYKGKLTPKTIMYAPALPNCNGTSMCNGGSNVQLKDDVMAAIDAAIYDTPFNHHSQLVGTESIPFLQYVKRYNGRMPFRTLHRMGKAESILKRGRL